MRADDVAAAAGWSGSVERFVRRLQPLRDRVAGCTGWRRVALAAALGAVAVAALPPIYLWITLVAAFSGLMWLIESESSALSAFWAGWWFGFGYFVFGLYWIANALLTKPEEFGWLAPIAVVALSALMALFPAAAAVATRLGRRSGVGGVLIFAAAWTFFEWVRSWAFSGFPWNLIGSVWTFSDAMIQFTALAGTYGLGLLTVAAAAMPAALVPAPPPAGGRSGRSTRTLLAVAAAFAVLAVVWTGGAVRLWIAGTADTVPGVRLRLVQPNIPQTEKWDAASRGTHFLKQLRMEELPAEPPPTHVIWSEAAAPFFLAENPEALALLGEATPADGLTIVGTLRRSRPPDEPPRIWNSLLAVNSDGDVVAAYDKSHLVPYGEYVPFRTFIGIASVAGGFDRLLPRPGYHDFDPAGPAARQSVNLLRGHFSGRRCRPRPPPGLAAQSYERRLVRTVDRTLPAFIGGATSRCGGRAAARQGRKHRHLCHCRSVWQGGRPDPARSPGHTRRRPAGRPRSGGTLRTLGKPGGFCPCRADGGGGPACSPRPPVTQPVDESPKKDVLCGKKFYRISRNLYFLAYHDGGVRLLIR